MLCDVSGHSHIHSAELPAWSCGDVASHHLEDSFLLPASLRPEERRAGLQILESCCPGPGSGLALDDCEEPDCSHVRSPAFPLSQNILKHSNSGLLLCPAGDL